MNEYHTQKHYARLYDTGQVCNHADVSYSWLLRRVKNNVFNPYAMWSGAYVWTDEDISAVRMRKRREDFKLIRGAY